MFNLAFLHICAQRAINLLTPQFNTSIISLIIIDFLSFLLGLCLLFKRTQQVQRSRLDTQKYFFSQRVVQHWNSLAQRVVDATSVTSFKRRLDNYTRSLKALPIKPINVKVKSQSRSPLRLQFMRRTVAIPRPTKVISAHLWQ